MKNHLDIGCGSNPRNPFNADNIFGIDISDRSNKKNDFHFIKSNLCIEDIPFKDSFFDTVSAYDFIEHIPRILYKDGSTILPFINLMNNIYRVLKNNGEFYAITPFYPRDSAFTDPTHVNFITKNTHNYFVEPHNWGRMYGLNTSFYLKRVEIVNFEWEVNGAPKNILHLIHKFYVRFRPKFKQHIVWHFVANK